MTKEVIRIEAMKCNGLMKPEYKRLCVDPQLTSFEVLRHLLSKAFGITGDFSLSYLSKQDSGAAIYLSLLSDWDVNAAFVGFSEPHLKLKVDLRPFDPGLDDWDVVGSRDTVSNRPANQNSNSLLGSLTESITSQVGRTMSQVSRVIGLRADIDPSESMTAVGDALFHRCLGPAGHLDEPGAFRLAVYRAGLQPTLRRVAWRHLLDVFPDGLSGAERFTYLRGKSAEYHALCSAWQLQMSAGDGHVAMLAALVREDVQRTDRSHPFFSDAGQQMALQTMLVTYAVSHPTLSYRQGMSDVAAPLLLVQGDEAHAYLCLCALLRRRARYFCRRSDAAVRMQLRHLAAVVRYHDAELHAYLAGCAAEAGGAGLDGGYHFCYRWLLLELKREFPLDDALHALEVLWSSLPPAAPPGGGVALAEAWRAGPTVEPPPAADDDAKNDDDDDGGKNDDPSSDDPPPPLPGPTQLGGGNPFLLHACAALLILHRDALLAATPSLGYSDVATYFGRRVRSHDVVAVVRRARKLYATYLRHVTDADDVSV